MLQRRPRAPKRHPRECKRQPKGTPKAPQSTNKRDVDDAATEDDRDYAYDDDVDDDDVDHHNADADHDIARHVRNRNSLATPPNGATRQPKRVKEVKKNSEHHSRSLQVPLGTTSCQCSLRNLKTTTDKVLASHILH